LKVGFRISYFNHQADLPEGLPDHLICDDTLESSLDQIKGVIRTWAENNDPEFRNLSINFIGPFPEETCRPDRRTPDQVLTEATSIDERLSALSQVAKARFESGQYPDARRYISELQDLLPSLENPLDAHYYRSTAQIVLGRLSLIEGDVETAKHHLIEAAIGPGSPIMSSFGPNMSLAHDLLLRGEDQAVLDFFQACGKFWERGDEKLDEWTAYVKVGLIPDFGANLNY
jgi:hypothetical protein